MANFEIHFGNHGPVLLVLQTKEEKNNPAGYQRTVLMVALVSMVGSWNIWKDSIDAEEHIEVLEKHLLPSR